ncbi:MAG: bifunctional diaminohydroxyphosphoribosylaminopyrimidine deaminase/5-amino-6-(5-phosphoribosylamino)uracil reductase RibD [Ignavibacteria bacterium]|jgi:diaminohydroxyphosphoribosylaminopyrimidine deaminase/5-amino-6-(5-phosphoribosylamino)uracil reductase
MDDKYINRCFELAKKGIGKVSPNPLVGCVVVKEDNIIGEGWHEEFGKSHAEINAFKNCITSPEGSTLYCNLEPCSHTNKKTPPCVPEIIKQKISKVIISNIDPNPDVNGKGIEQLRKSGIEVINGIEEERGKELNRIFFKYVKAKKPYVTVKVAQTADGKITEVNGKQSWITGNEAGEFVHRQRGIFDAVLVGANSVIVDDPMLTVRHIEGRNPIRIILDGKLSMPESARVIKNDEPEKTWIVTGNDSNADKKNLLKQKGVKIIEFQVNGKKNIDVNELLKQLGSNNISSVLVEGGRQVFSQFIEQELFDELVVLQSPKIFGKGLDSVSLSKTINLKMKSAEKLGKDLKIIYERV